MSILRNFTASGGKRRPTHSFIEFETYIDKEKVRTLEGVACFMKPPLWKVSNCVATAFTDSKYDRLPVDRSIFI